MKKNEFLIICFILFSCHGIGQDNPVLNSNGYHIINGGEFINPVLDTVANRTGSVIHGNDDFNLAWYAPNNTPGLASCYDKLEIGVQLSDPINKRIIKDRNGKGAMNPFNPEEVDVYADFYYKFDNKWFGPTRINGFYYVEYQREKEGWSQEECAHNFRIRYAPPVSGEYKCKVFTVIRKTDTLSNEAFTFECEESTNKGFVNVGENKRYFKVGNDPYFPVGQNLTGPNTKTLSIEWRNTVAEPEMYDNFYGLMNELSENGANYFRYIVSPWQSEIEFEHLGYYGSRMSNAWEFDKLLDTAKALDLKLHYNMAMHYSFETPSFYAMTFWDWSAKGDPFSPHNPDDAACWYDNDHGYCYRNELDMINPIDFLSDSTAMVYYKRRLRYMVARWGFSTSIGVMELLSEANNFGEQSLIDHKTINGKTGCYHVRDTANLVEEPYTTRPTDIIPDLMAWQIEMCRYIKEDLGHTQHPLAVNYTGSSDIENGDRTYFSEYVDIASYNSYFLAVNKEEKTYQNVTEYYHNKKNMSHYLDKPVMNSEYGTGSGTFNCDANSGYIRRVCLSPFTGTPTAALTWDSHLNEQDVWKQLGPVRALLEGIPLDQENWSVQEPMVQKDKSVEVFHLRKGEWGENSKIVGAISNRTFNYWTQGDTINCMDTTLRPPLEYAKMKDFEFADLNKSELRFKDMGTRKIYQIHWFNAISGDFISTTTETSNVFGRLEIAFPGVLTGDNESPILFFQICRSDVLFKP